MYITPILTKYNKPDPILLTIQSKRQNTTYQRTIAFSFNEGILAYTSSYNPAKRPLQYTRNIHNHSIRIPMFCLSTAFGIYVSSSTKQINRPKPIHKFHSDSSALRPGRPIAHRIIIPRNRSYTIYCIWFVLTIPPRPLSANRPQPPTKIHSKYKHTHKDPSTIIKTNQSLYRNAPLAEWSLEPHQINDLFDLAFIYIIFVSSTSIPLLLLKFQPIPLTTTPYIYHTKQPTAYHSAIQFAFFVYLTVIV